MTALTMPTIVVEVAFQDTITYSAPVWTDVTRWVLGANTTMGRQHELQQVQPSTATITLDNHDGRFSPWNTASPYYYAGLGLTPGHPVKIKATWLGVTYDVFTGYIKSLVPTYGASRSTMTMACYDWLALLNFSTLDVNTYQALALVGATHYWPLSDTVGSPTAADLAGSVALFPSDGATFGAPGPFPSIPVTGGNWWAHNGLHSTATVTLGAAWTIEGWVNTTVNVTAQYLLFSDGLTTLDLDGFGRARIQSVAAGPDLTDGKWHYVAATADGTTLTLYVDGQRVSSFAYTYSGPGSTVQVGFDADSSNGPSSFAQFALCATARTPAQIAALYAVGTAGFAAQDAGTRASGVLLAAGVPSAFVSSTMAGSGVTTLESATSSLGSTTAMSYLNTVMTSERGVLYQNTSGVVTFLNRHYPYESTNANTSQYTFGYASGQLHYYSANLVPGEDDIDIWNNVNVGRNGGTTQNAFDTTSQSRYGRRTMSTTGLLLLDDLQSMALAQGLLLQYKDAKPRVRSMTVDSTIGAGAALPAMLGLDLLDRITINWRPIDGTTVDFSQPSLVEQITHTITPEQWTTTLAVTPVGTETFWRIDMTALDNTVPTGLGF